MSLRRIFFFMLLLVPIVNHAQNTRIRNNNNILWLNGFGTFRMTPKWSIHSEFQFRRAEGLNYGQQELYRFGINNKLNEQMVVRIGGAYVETHPYGTIPLNVFGKAFSEYRTFQMLTLQNPIKNFKISHRFMLEQRWVGKYSKENLDQEDVYTYLNRARYQFRVQSPEWKLKSGKSGFYALFQDEIFVGFGRNVGENIFDQNRFSVQLGCKVNSHLSVETGFLSQILQFSREIQGNDVMQYNRGLVFNLIFQ
jgi:hypothetical protein